MILNKTYDYKTTGYLTLPSVDEDGIKVLETLKFLGVKNENIFSFNDAKREEMVKFKCKMIGIFEKAQETKTNVLFYFYYAGHGVMYGTSTSTQIVCSDGSRFSWEEELAALSNYIQTYILAFFDCCRVRK